jgi:opacity protein-like surface antigen
MKRFIGRFAIVIALVTVGFGTYAQETGEKAAGGNLAVGTGNEFTNFGIGVKFQYNAAQAGPGIIRGEGTFTQFFKKEFGGDMKGSGIYGKMYDLSLNAHYLYPLIKNKLNVFPLVGVSLMGEKVGMKIEEDEYSEDEMLETGALFNGQIEGKYATNFGLNIGAGFDCKLTDQWVLNAELKYRITKPTITTIEIGADLNGGILEEKKESNNRFMISIGVAYKF